MNKRVLVVVIVLGALIAGSIAALALSLPAPTPTPESSVAADSTPSSTPTPTPTATLERGRYLAYKESLFPRETGRTFLFFYASWCSQCRDINAGILAEGVPDGVTIFKANFDTEQALEQRYGVTMRTTFVEVDADGNELQRFVAYDTPTFDAVIAAMF